MDLLSDVMALLRAKGSIYGRLELGGPYAYLFPRDIGHCLVVTHGQCFLTVDDGPPLAVSAGDFVCLPQRRSLVLAHAAQATDAREFSPQESADFLAHGIIRNEGGGSPVALVTGCITFAQGEKNLLLEQLPPVLHLRAIDQQTTPWYASVIALFTAEVVQKNPGSEAILHRLVELLLVHALRSHFPSQCTKNGPSWLRAMYVSKLGPALQLMHEKPEHNWTVDALADAVHMSRSAFSAKFKDEVGVTPIEHLTRWRMIKATRMIQDGNPPKLADIAYAVGYESESAFRKAFARLIGVSPKVYRAQNG
jgi:AraC-like DNA-binding protein